MLRQPAADRLYVNVYSNLRPEPLMLLLDTGADVTIIRRNLCDQELCPFDEEIVYGANPLKITGSVAVQIHHDGQNMSHQFLVAEDDNLPQDGILGLDFLRYVAAVIDTGKLQMTYVHQGQEIMWPLDTESSISTYFNRYQEDETYDESDEEDTWRMRYLSPCFSPTRLDDLVLNSSTPIFDKKTHDFESEEEEMTTEEEEITTDEEKITNEAEIILKEKISVRNIKRIQKSVEPLEIEPKRLKLMENDTIEELIIFEGKRVSPHDKLLMIHFKYQENPEKSVEVSIKRNVFVQINKIVPLQEILEAIKLALEDSEHKNLLIYYQDAKLLGSQSINRFKGISQNFFRGTEITFNIIDKKEEIKDTKEQIEIIQKFHDNPTSGHLGIKRTTDKISQFFNWPDMGKQIKNYVLKCTSCQQNKMTTVEPVPMQMTTTATKAMEVVFMDVVGPTSHITERGNRYIATFLDDLTKYLVAVPIQNYEAETLSEILVRDVILQRGIPDNIVSDNAPEFVEEVFEKTCKLLNVKKIFTTAYHSQANKVEKVHRELKTYLRHCCSSYQDNWDMVLPYYVSSYNATEHTSTKYSPFELMYGRKANLPVVLTNAVDPINNYDDYVAALKFKFQHTATRARENMTLAKEMNKKAYDKGTPERSFEPGDLVLFRNNSDDKREALFVGPYEVQKRTSDATYVIKVKNRLRSVNIKRLRNFY